MGHCSASDAYTCRFDDAIEGVPWKFKCVDDTLLYDSSVEESFWHVYDFLSICSSKGITLKPEKFKFCRREVDFVGFDVGWDSYRPSEDCLSAIRKFSMPQAPTISDIRSWYGFVNQLAPFLASALVEEAHGQTSVLGRESSGEISTCTRHHLQVGQGWPYIL